MSGRPVPGIKLSDCRDCADPIVFVHLDSGRLIPCNPIPDDRGNVAAAKIGNGLHGYVLSREHGPQAFYTLRMVPHYATCSERDPKAPEPEPELPPMLF